jgi:hypothetical protein
MVDPSDIPAPSVPRRRRYRRPVFVTVCVGLLYLIGQGAGLFGASPIERQGEGNDAITSEQSARLEAAPSQKESLGTQEKVSESSSVLTGAPQAETEQVAKLNSPQQQDSELAETVHSPAPATETAPSSEVIGMPEDRFHSLLSLLELHVLENALGSATASLQRIRSQPLSETQSRALDAFDEKLVPMRQAMEERIIECVRSGEVIAANQLSNQLIVNGEWSLLAVAAVSPALELGDNWLRGVQMKGEVLPQSEPLPRNRKVRLRWRDKIWEGVVATSRSDQVTVRVQSDGAQMYPTVRAVACEPIEATSAEAVEMGYAAMHAGAPRLARLWLLHAHLIGVDLSSRGLQLMKLLQQ